MKNPRLVWLRVLVLAVLALGAAVVVAPPLLESRHVAQAISDLELLSDAARQYLHHTGKTCEELQALIDDPGVAGWRGPYLASDAVPPTPWGGSYRIDVARGVVGIAADAARAPEKFRLGGIAELSQAVRADPHWWADDNGPR